MILLALNGKVFVELLSLLSETGQTLFRPFLLSFSVLVCESYQGTFLLRHEHLPEVRSEGLPMLYLLQQRILRLFAGNSCTAHDKDRCRTGPG